MGKKSKEVFEAFSAHEASYEQGKFKGILSGSGMYLLILGVAAHHMWVQKIEQHKDIGFKPFLFVFCLTWVLNQVIMHKPHDSLNSKVTKDALHKRIFQRGLQSFTYHAERKGHNTGVLVSCLIAPPLMFVLEAGFKLSYQHLSYYLFAGFICLAAGATARKEDHFN